MKYILITGGCGFIGSNFINYILTKYPQYVIYNIDILYYCASKDNIRKDIQEHPNYNFIKGNINDKDLIKYIIQTHNINCIIHFAAQSHVDNSFSQSLQYTEDNIKGTHTLLEVVRTINPSILFIHFSTDEVYGESRLDEEPKNEISVLCPTNPYAATKAAAEMLVNAYKHSYDLQCIITRCNNVYGPNQYPEKLIPKFINLLKTNQKCTIHGDGSSLRSFIHVYDVCTAVDIILHKGVVSEIYNIGSSEANEKTVIEISKLLVQKICSSIDYKKYILLVKDRPFNDKRYFITNNKLKKLGWFQTIDLEEGLDTLMS
jgi:dTDP-glucose 4,6-dehydratase